MGIRQVKRRLESPKKRKPRSFELNFLKDFGELQLKWAEEELRQHTVPEEDRTYLKLSEESRDVFEQACAVRLYCAALKARVEATPEELLFLAETVQKQEPRLQEPLEEAFSILLSKGGNFALSYSKLLEGFFQEAASSWDGSNIRESPFPHIHKIMRRAPANFVVKLARRPFESYGEMLAMLKAWEFAPMESAKVVPISGLVDHQHVLLWSVKRKALRKRKNEEKAERVMDAAIYHSNKDERIPRLRKALLLIKAVEERWDEETATPYSFLAEAVANLDLATLDHAIADISQVRGEDVYRRARYWAELSKIPEPKRAW